MNPHENKYKYETKKYKQQKKCDVTRTEMHVGTHVSSYLACHTAVNSACGSRRKALELLIRFLPQVAASEWSRLNRSRSMTSNSAGTVGCSRDFSVSDPLIKSCDPLIKSCDPLIGLMPSVDVGYHRIKTPCHRGTDSSARYADTSCNFIQVAAGDSSAPYVTSDTGNGYETRDTGSHVSSKYISSGVFDCEKSGEWSRVPDERSDYSGLDSTFDSVSSFSTRGYSDVASNTLLASGEFSSSYSSGHENLCREISSTLNYGSNTDNVDCENLCREIGKSISSQSLKAGEESSYSGIEVSYSQRIDQSDDAKPVERRKTPSPRTKGYEKRVPESQKLRSYDKESLAEFQNSISHDKKSLVESQKLDIKDWIIGRLPVSGHKENRKKQIIEGELVRSDSSYTTSERTYQADADTSITSKQSKLSKDRRFIHNEEATPVSFVATSYRTEIITSTSTSSGDQSDSTRRSKSTVENRQSKLKLTPIDRDSTSSTHRSNSRKGSKEQEELFVPSDTNTDLLIDKARKCKSVKSKKAILVCMISKLMESSTFNDGIGRRLSRYRRRQKHSNSNINNDNNSNSNSNSNSSDDSSDTKYSKYTKYFTEILNDTQNDEMDTTSIPSKYARYSSEHLSSTSINDTDGNRVSRLDDVGNSRVPMKPYTSDGSRTSRHYTADESGATSNEEADTERLPNCLSVGQMISLGSVITQKSRAIRLEKFYADGMVWSSQPQYGEFIIEKLPIGNGTYREAFRAVCLNYRSLGVTKEWVVKRFRNNECFTTSDTDARKTVQMHMLAKHFTELVSAYLESTRKWFSFGDVFKYNEIYYGDMDREVVTVEEYVSGNFEKYINNNGEVLGDPSKDIVLKALAYQHFSFQVSNKHLLLTDFQGVGYNLVDPEISSLQLRDDHQNKLFAPGNLSVFSLKKFVESHTCNRYCSMLNLRPITHKDQAFVQNVYNTHTSSLMNLKITSKLREYLPDS